jgi:hypothetical protein
MGRGDRLMELAKIGACVFNFLPYVKIQEPGNLAMDYVLWPHLVEFYVALAREKLIDLIKAKQIGISWALAINSLWEIMTIPGWKVLEFSKGQDESIALLEKSRIVYKNLPEWIRGIPDYELGPNSSEKFGFHRMGSVIMAYPSTPTAGIGETAGRVIHDESDFHEFYEVNLSHTRATVADSLERKLASVSTVDKTKPASYFKRHWKDARDGKNGFRSMFFGFDARPDRGEEFYRQMVMENEDTPWVVEANFPRTAEEALSPLAATSCFSKDRLVSLWDNSVRVKEVREGIIHIFQSVRVGVSYGAGVDVGEGVGLDYSCLSIVGKEGLNSEVVAVIYSNQIGTDAFAFEVDKLCREYNTPLLNVDNIGIGRAVVDKLQQLGYPRLYYQDEKRQKAGWSLTRPNKRELLVKLVERINNGSLITRFMPQVQELMEYQWVNGYPESTGKTHGDTVIPLMLYCAIESKIGTRQEASMYVGGNKIF